MMVKGRSIKQMGRIREKNPAVRNNLDLNRRISIVVSGDEGDRTPGLGIANAALSRLSYIPTISILLERMIIRPHGCVFNKSNR
jgi:hypothetical protein